jgi:tagatose 1,6-diphosphate aldolase
LLLKRGEHDANPFTHEETHDARQVRRHQRGGGRARSLNEVLAKGAKPWWDFYGGKHNIEVVDLSR